MHPFAAVLARKQLKGLDQRNAGVVSRVRQLNDCLLHLPGLSEPFCRPEARRVYYSNNMLFLDEAKAGFSRAALLKALQAEGVRASSGEYPEQHKFKTLWFVVRPEFAGSVGLGIAIQECRARRSAATSWQRTQAAVPLCC